MRKLLILALLVGCGTTEVIEVEKPESQNAVSIETVEVEKEVIVEVEVEKTVIVEVEVEKEVIVEVIVEKEVIVEVEADITYTTVVDEGRYTNGSPRITRFTTVIGNDLEGNSWLVTKKQIYTNINFLTQTVRIDGILIRYKYNGTETVYCSDRSSKVHTRTITDLNHTALIVTTMDCETGGFLNKTYLPAFYDQTSTYQYSPY